jgi:hypothetical protein
LLLLSLVILSAVKNPAFLKGAKATRVPSLAK